MNSYLGHNCLFYAGKVSIVPEKIFIGNDLCQVAN